MTAISDSWDSFCFLSTLGKRVGTVRRQLSIKPLTPLANCGQLNLTSTREMSAVAP